MTFDPALHHRRSIRLKGHDYSGGGLYFVTICAHREFIAAARGHPFGRLGRASPMRDIIEERMRITAEKCPGLEWVAHVVMPDHFHALIRMPRGTLRLGDIIGGFKSAASREWRRTGEACLAPAPSSGDTLAPAPSSGDTLAPAPSSGDTLAPAPSSGDTCVAPAHPSGGAHGYFPKHFSPNMRIWHRNYYERIVRSPEAAGRIERYIRMNPWRCVQELGAGLRGMGNPSLWSAVKVGVLASRGKWPDAGLDGREAGQWAEAEMNSEAKWEGEAEMNSEAKWEGEAEMNSEAKWEGEAGLARTVMGGFHSPAEKAFFTRWLDRGGSAIWCPAWDLDSAARSPRVLKALEENRLLVLEMRNRAGTLAAAEQRNRFVIEQADHLWIPHLAPGGMLDRLVRSLDIGSKRLIRPPRPFRDVR